MFFDAGKVGAELTAGFQIGIGDRAMFPEIAQPALAPHADGTLIFGWQFEIRQEIIALLRVGAVHLLKQFFHRKTPFARSFYKGEFGSTNVRFVVAD